MYVCLCVRVHRGVAIGFFFIAERRAESFLFVFFRWYSFCKTFNPEKFLLVLMILKEIAQNRSEYPEKKRTFYFSLFVRSIGLSRIALSFCRVSNCQRQRGWWSVHLVLSFSALTWNNICTHCSFSSSSSFSLFGFHPPPPPPPWFFLLLHVSMFVLYAFVCFISLSLFTLKWTQFMRSFLFQIKEKRRTTLSFNSSSLSSSFSWMCSALSSPVRIHPRSCWNDVIISYPCLTNLMNNFGLEYWSASNDSISFRSNFSFQLQLWTKSLFVQRTFWSFGATTSIRRTFLDFNKSSRPKRVKPKSTTKMFRWFSTVSRIESNAGNAQRHFPSLVARRLAASFDVILFGLVSKRDIPTNLDLINEFLDRKSVV